MVVPRHVRVHPECDVCAEPVLAEEQCVVLVGNANSTSHSIGIIESTQKTHPVEAAAEMCFCRTPTCMACEAGSLPTCSIHADCLRVVIRHCTARDALDRLWLASAWRRQLWTGALVPPLGLDLARNKRASILGSDLSTLLDVAQRCGLRQLRVLPIELLRDIQIMSQPDPFWRYITAVTTANQLSTMSSYPLRSLPLDAVASWERGGTPRLAVNEGKDDLLPIIRLTIDVNGFKALERLAEPPTDQSRRFDNLLFITDTRSRLADTTAHFKNGLLRLTLPENMDRGLHVWDTPTPPDLQRCTIRQGDTAACLRCCTIDLNKTSGLTLFFRNGSAMAIHAHSKKAPSASRVFDSLRSWCGLRFVWVYVPLPLEDDLTGFGSLVQPDDSVGYTVDVNQSCFLLRSDRVGDTVVGHYPAGSGRRFLVDDRRPTTLVYAMARFHPISIVSPYSNEGEIGGSLIKPRSFPRLDDVPDEGWWSAPYVSHAPLDNVRRVQVFLEENGVCCRGLLFEYDGGGQRALGQCRLLVDRVKTYNWPSQISFTHVSRKPADSFFPSEYDGARVAFDGVPKDGEGWRSFAMTGTLCFSFTGEQTQLEMRQSADSERTTSEEDESDDGSLLGQIGVSHRP